MQLLKLFLIALGVFLVTDALWLGFIAKAWYFKEYANWLRLENGQLQPIWWAALLVYLLLSLAIIVFVLPLSQGSLISAFTYGAIIGLIIYGSYNFTCLAIFEDWPVRMTFVDWAWGTFLCGWCATITVYFSRML